jgi:hypothetical protein
MRGTSHGIAGNRMSIHRVPVAQKLAFFQRDVDFVSDDVCDCREMDRQKNCENLDRAPAEVFTTGDLRRRWDSGTRTDGGPND